MPDTNIKAVGNLHRPLFHILILGIIAVIAYANTFHVPFLFDDETSISENPAIQNLSNFFTNRSGYDDHPNRYIGYLTFALNYHFGGLSVIGYHAVNLAIHIANGLLVYTLVRLTLRTPFFVTRNRQPGSCQSLLVPGGPWSLVPFLTALLFVTHPIQTQSVTYIVQRLTSLATFFYLASLVLHVRWRLVHAGGASFFSRSVLPFYVLSLLSALLAMKTKEIAFTLPVMVLLYEVSFFGQPVRRHWTLLTPLLLTVFIIPLTMINLQKPAGEFLSDVSKATMVQTSLSRWDYLCTQFSVIVTYLRLLVLPVNQNLDYDYPVSHSLLEPRTFLSLFLLLALFGLAVYLYRRSMFDTQNSPHSSLLTPHSSRLIAFGLFWFFITLSVESSIIPIVDVIYEHRLYLPSIGFFIAIGALLSAGTASLHTRSPLAGKLTLPLVAVIVLLLAAATFARNRAWKDGETLWLDVRAKSPAKWRPYTNLGAYYGEQERVNDSILAFETAFKLDPSQPETLSNLVLLYVSAERQQDAATACKTLRRLDPDMKFPVKLYQILRMPDNGDQALRGVRTACGFASTQNNE